MADGVSFCFYVMCSAVVAVGLVLTLACWGGNAPTAIGIVGLASIIYGAVSATCWYRQASS